MKKYHAGEVHEIDYPFAIATDTMWGTMWDVGCRSQDVYPDDSELVADAIGSMIITIVDVHKPAEYPTRIFFTRQWRDPDGNVFGKGGLHIKTSQWLTQRLSGFHYDFRMATDKESQELRAVWNANSCVKT